MLYFWIIFWNILYCQCLYITCKSYIWYHGLFTKSSCLKRHISCWINLKHVYFFILILSIQTIDIDECDAGTDSCDTASSTCVNLIGSYNCTCNAGYEEAGNLTCSGKYQYWTNKIYYAPCVGLYRFINCIPTNIFLRIECQESGATQVCVTLKFKVMTQLWSHLMHHLKL